eukprot:1674439-Rhodomonas_salina.2
MIIVGGSDGQERTHNLEDTQEEHTLGLVGIGEQVRGLTSSECSTVCGLERLDQGGCTAA